MLLVIQLCFLIGCCRACVGVGWPSGGRLCYVKAVGLVLTAYVSERNVASVRILEKLGFQRGGLIRQYAGYPGASDTYTYFRLPRS